MILRYVCWSTFLCLVLRAAVKAQMEVNEQGYQDVLISFASNVPSDKALEHVQSIRDLLEKTSSVLQTAIGIRIATVTFLLPPSWSTEKWENIPISPASSAQLATRSDISVDATEESPFGKQPVTLQYGGCGVPGHQINLPLDFLKSTEEYPKGKLLAREWLKYRYGVFEENGFKYDKLYPDFYRIPGRSEVIVTECTDSNVTYTFKNTVDQPCDMDPRTGFDYCRNEPDKESAANVTSSLMYFHKHLPNMEHICGKDGRRHLDTVRSKQNVLCNGQSIWDVINSSKDFKQPQADPVQESIQFSYVQESKPRFVVLLENSENLHEKQNVIRFALRRFYYDLPPKTKLAIYTYNNEVTTALTYGELNEKIDLGAIADFTYSAGNICASCGLVKATEILLGHSSVEKGSVLLITASSLDKMPAIDEKLKSSGISLNVIRFHDENDTVDKSYEDLGNSFSKFSYHEIWNSLNDSQTFTSLYSFLQNPVPKSNDDFEIKTNTVEMSGSEFVRIPQDETASLYTLWLAKSFASNNSVQCKDGDADVTLRLGPKGTDIASFIFDPRKSDITCKLSSTKQLPILTQVQMTTKKGNYFIFDTWIHDMSTEKEQLPIKIYAKIYYGGYPVKDANVTTIVTSDKNPEQTVTMLDNGRGEPDITEGDGVYSGIFTGFSTAGDYQITVKIDHNNGQAKIGKEFPVLMSATCCGSKITSMDSVVPAFEMERLTVYTAKNKRPDDGYQPFRIVDLEVRLFNVGGMIVLAWSPPGEEKVGRYDLKMFQNREDAIQNFDTKGVELNSSAIIRAGVTGKMDVFILYVKDLENDTDYCVALRSWSEFNKQSEISNLAEFTLPKDVPTTTASTTEASSTPGGIGTNPDETPRKKTTEIVVGVVVGIVVLCILVYLAYYFFVQKPKREKEARARHAARTSSGPAGH